MDPSEPFEPSADSGHPETTDSRSHSQLPDSSDNPYSAPRPRVNFAPPVLPQLGRPRWWTTIAISGISFGTFLCFSVVMTLAAVYVVHGDISMAKLSDQATLESVSASRIGLLMLVVLPQLALVAPAIIAGILSPVATRQRLSLVRGRWPIWAWIAAAAATPLVGMASGVVVSLFLEESETLRQMTEIFRDHGNSGFLIPLALMIGATPALCEELLFRGYVQTRLTKSFPPIVGILVASFMFAIFHIDPVHVVAVFPLGVFLGWVTWKSGSIFPAMMGHFVNNVISVVAVVLAPESNTDVLALPTITLTLSIFGLGIVGVAAVAFAAYTYGSPGGHETTTSRDKPFDNHSM